MNKKSMLLGFVLVAVALNAAAQTVTGSGATNWVPIFTGSTPGAASSTIGNSPIVVSGDEVGIGSNPQALLDVGVSGWDTQIEGPSVSMTSNPWYDNVIFKDSGNNNAEVFRLGSSNYLNTFLVYSENGWPIHMPGTGGLGIGYGYPWPTTLPQMLSVTGGGYFSGSVGIGGSAPEAPLTVSKNIQNGLGTNQTINTALWTGADVNLVIGGDLNGSSLPFLQSRSQGSANSIGSTNYHLALNPYGGNVGIGTLNPLAKLEINGALRFTGDGSVQTTAWTGVLCGGDYAESMNVTGDRTKYGPGDLLVLDTEHPGKVLKSIEPYSTVVSGIYATKPGVVGRRQLTPSMDSEVPMAMVGVVPTHVSAENGPIHIGDLLVASSTPGHAMKGTDRSRMLGAVVGKAMAELDSGTGVIEVLVTLQ